MSVTQMDVVFSWSFQPASVDEMKGAGLMVTQSWSVGPDRTPGKGNLLLAAAVRGIHALLPDIGIYPQEQVAWCLQDIPLVGVAGPTLGPRLRDQNTHSIAEIQTKYCQERLIRKVIVVAHPWHMNRALWTYKAFGLDPIPAPVEMCPALYQDESLLHWTCRFPRRLKYYKLREIASRELFYLQGKI